MKRAADMLLALLLLALAFPAAAHAAAPVALAVVAVVLGWLGHHLPLLLTAAAVVVTLRAIPKPSHRLLTWLAGAWLSRLILARIPATA